MYVNPLDMVFEVSPEQVAASLARLETELKHLSSAIDRLSGHLDKMENRLTLTERIAERAQSVWWTITKSLGVVAGSAGAAAWLLEHGSKLAGTIR
jgi:hypothetical protein